MSEPLVREEPPTQIAALQSLLMMSAALGLNMVIWQDGPRALLWIFSFSLSFIVFLTTVLFLLEKRVHPDVPDPVMNFSRPASGVLGFSAALFLSAGFWMSAAVVIALAIFLLAYRRRAMAGDHNLIPATATELGLIAGIGAAVAGMFLLGVNEISAGLV